MTMCTHNGIKISPTVTNMCLGLTTGPLHGQSQIGGSDAFITKWSPNGTFQYTTQWAPH